MEILDTKQKGKSVVCDDIYITYNIGYEAEDVLRDVHGFVFKGEKTIGFVSYDHIRSGSQFSLNPDNGLSASEKKLAFDTFTDDIEALIAD